MNHSRFRRWQWAWSISLVLTAGGLAHGQSAGAPAATQRPADSGQLDAADDSSPEEAVSDFEREILQQAEGLINAFNAQDVAGVLACFADEAELVDDAGVIHAGREAIGELLTLYFERFPGAQMWVEVDSIRKVGPLAIEEGVRSFGLPESDSLVDLRYTLLRLQTADGWKIISLRDEQPLTLPSHPAVLSDLTWLIGNWVNDGGDLVVHIDYRWDESRHFILGNYQVTRDGQTVMNSSQRIGWDPVQRTIRSWTFDADGGFSQGNWTEVDGAWVIKSSAVLPEGLIGSATLTMQPITSERFVLRSVDRLVGDVRADDVEVTIVKRPPAPGAAAAQSQGE
jgi:uncharacterized protein (TIGR02246 family)